MDVLFCSLLRAADEPVSVSERALPSSCKPCQRRCESCAACS